MVRTRSQAAADAWQRFNRKQQVRKARLRDASLAATFKGPELRVHKRNRKPNTPTTKNEATTSPRDGPRELPYVNLATQDISDIAPKIKDFSGSIKNKRAGTKTVRILEPAEQRPPPIHTNVPWPLVGIENLGSAGSAPMDISAGSSVKTPGPWLKEQGQLNGKSGKGQEKMIFSPPLEAPWNVYVRTHDNRERSATRSPSLMFYPVWELADPSSLVGGWRLRGYVST